MEARGLQAELWTELSLKKPSQSRLNSIGCSLRRTMDDASATFAHILRLNPNGVQVLRRYANFLAEVRCPFLLYLLRSPPSVLSQATPSPSRAA